MSLAQDTVQDATNLPSKQVSASPFGLVPLEDAQNSQQIVEREYDLGPVQAYLDAYRAEGKGKISSVEDNTGADGPPPAAHICPVCRTSYALRASLTRHLPLCQTWMLAAPAAPATGKQRYACPSCAKAYTRPSRLVQHVTNGKCPTGESHSEGYECLACGRYYWHRKSLYKHQRQSGCEVWMPKDGRKERGSVGARQGCFKIGQPRTRLGADIGRREAVEDGGEEKGVVQTAGSSAQNGARRGTENERADTGRQRVSRRATRRRLSTATCCYVRC